MFLEPTMKKGWIEVVCGSMFSGKTEELIRRLKRAKIAHQNIQIFKPATDIRYHQKNIVSHDDNFIPSTPVTQAKDILNLVKNVEVVGIDEAQFFDEGLVEVCETLALRGIRVVIAGLDMDYMGKPFGSMPALLASAEYITKLHAICVQCGQLASYSYLRNGHGEEQVVLGAQEKYEARCRTCFYAGA